MIVRLLLDSQRRVAAAWWKLHVTYEEDGQSMIRLLYSSKQCIRRQESDLCSFRQAEPHLRNGAGDEARTTISEWAQLEDQVIVHHLLGARAESDGCLPRFDYAAVCIVGVVA